MFKSSSLIVRLMVLFLLLPLAASLAPVPAQAATQSSKVFHPTADAFVRAAYPNSNSGKSTLLRVRGAPVIHTYLRFSVANLGGQPITGAHLLLYAKANSSQELRARVVTSDSWGESSITYKNAPAIGSLIDTAPGTSAGKWVSFNVGSYVKSAGAYSFAVTSSSSKRLDLAARESGANAPRLVVTLGSSSGSSTGIKHVFIIVMENHSYTDVWNRSSTPYITQLGNSYARATNYHAITHPSLPNYLDMFAGSNYGITNDCSPSSSCHINARNLADNLEAKGLRWKGYMDSMPGPCYLKSSGDYAPKHNPFVYFDNIRNNSARCNSHVVPFSALASDLKSLSTTPNYAFISPNLCNDMHDCSTDTGDNWLKSHVPPILNSAACKADKCLLVLTWDEDDGGSGNHVLTIFAGSAARQGITSSASYTHYSLLRTVESIFGLPTQTSHDAAASVMKDLLR